MKFITASKMTLGLCSIAVLGACSNTSGIQGESPAATALDSMSFNLNLHPMDKTVCDPFGGDGGPISSPKQGIEADLFYRSGNQPRYYSSLDYITKTTPSVKKIFLKDLNAPTRMFDKGFSTLTSDVIKDDQGNLLIEYFGLRMKTVLRLPDGMEPGRYEIAALSDDGLTLKAQINGTQTVLINSDGDHPTRMGCSTQVLNMTEDSKIPMEISYYQGPRYHIAAVLMWRKLANNQQAGLDSECGQMGNERYFHPSYTPQDSRYEQSAYKGLLNRGWKVVSSSAFQVSDAAEYNICYEGQSPKISQFRIADLVGTRVKLTWTTDMPATSQILVTNENTGEVTLTTSDNLLRTTHEVTLRGLQPSTVYKAQAVSVSASLGKAISSEIRFATSD